MNEANEQNKTVYRVEGFSCANCAGKFERKVKELAGVQDAKVNFGASKISVVGHTTVEELEKVGAFENLKVYPERPKNQKVYRVEGFSCANCAGKFERNVKQLPGVQDAKVNFGASKISVIGETTIQELEKAGAFEGLKVMLDKPTAVIEPKTEKVRFYKKHQVLIFSALLIVLGYLSSYINGEKNVITILLFLSAIVIGGYSLLKLV